MAFSIPEYNERIIANPESRPQINLNLPKELSDTSHIDRMANKISNFQKEETEILLDMKKERDDGIVDEFMNIYNTDRIAKITELKEKYKGANAQGIVDEFKKWQDDYYTSHIGFSSQNEDGTLYLENDEQINLAREQLAKGLPSEINTLSTYAATELENYRQNQFTARTQFAVDDLADERDVNNIAMGIGNIYSMVNEHYKGESEEYKRYVAGKLVNESLSVNVADMIATGETLDQLNLAEQMLKEGVVADNLTNKTKMDLAEKLKEKQLKILGEMLAVSGTTSKGSGSKGGSTKTTSIGEDLAYGGVVPSEKIENLSPAERQKVLNSAIKTTGEIESANRENNEKMVSLVVNYLDRKQNGEKISEEQVANMAQQAGLLPDNFRSIITKLDEVGFMEEAYKALPEDLKEEEIEEEIVTKTDWGAKIWGWTKDISSAPFEGIINLFSPMRADAEYAYQKGREGANLTIGVKTKDNLSEHRNTINRVADGNYDKVEDVVNDIYELALVSPAAGAVARDMFFENESAKAFYVKYPNYEKAVETEFLNATGSTNYNTADFKDLKKRVALKKISPMYKDTPVAQVVADVFNEKYKLETPRDCLVNTITTANIAFNNKEKKDKTPRNTFIEQEIRKSLDGDEYDKYDLEDNEKDEIVNLLMFGRLAEAETFFRAKIKWMK